MSVVLALFALTFPALVVRNRHRRLVSVASPIVLCYVAGIILGNVGIVDSDGATGAVAEALQAGTVLLAIPLLLFGSDLRQWARLARPTILSFALAVLTIAVVAPVTAHFLAGDIAEQPANLAGMTVGVYTGGTANMAAIGTALKVDNSVFVAMNAADVVVSSLYLLGLMTVLPRLLSRVLPAFAFGEGGGTTARATVEAHDEFAFTPSRGQVGRALGFAVAGVLAAVAVAFAAVAVLTDTEAILDSDAFGTAAILAITSVGVLGSFQRRVRTLEGTYEVGQYLFLVFAVAIGTLANLAQLADSLTTVLPFVATALAVATVAHYGLCAVFRIDRDTAMITSTAAVFGPPFVGPIAGVLGNREIVVSGMTTGVVGLAVGNYAGLAVANLLG